MVRQSRTPLNDVYEYLGKHDLGLPPNLSGIDPFRAVGQDH